MLDSGSPVINGSGSQTRDFVFVRDVAQANLLAINSDFSGEINISTAKETSINELFSALKGITRSDAPEKHGPPVTGEQLRSVISCEKARQILGWSPTIPLAQGLSETVQYFKEKRLLPNSAATV
jgi:UDP-glucose 4-epimerase